MVGKNSNKLFWLLNYFPANLDWFLICWFLKYFINSSVLSPGTLRILKNKMLKSEKNHLHTESGIVIGSLFMLSVKLFVVLNLIYQDVRTIC